MGLILLQSLPHFNGFHTLAFYTPLMKWVLDRIGELYGLEHWPTWSAGLRIALLLLLFICCLRLWLSPVGQQQKKKSGLPWSYRLFFFILVTSFSVLLVHQAGWQLAGQRKPEFVSFMQLHDRRAFNPAHHIERGRLLDRQGDVLAETIDQTRRARRRYPLGPHAAHAVGYVDPKFGSFGMEKHSHGVLMGASLQKLDEWKNIGQGLLEEQRKVVGYDVRLTLDARLQRQASRLLGQRKGAVVLLDVHNGDLLVCASTPSFDPHRLDQKLFSGQRGDSVLLNRATHGLYPPGSTLKVFTAAAALSADINPLIDCPAEGWTTSAKYPPIHDYAYYAALKEGRTWAGYGRMDMATALAKSSNIYFARLGVDLGLARMTETAKQMSFNQRLPLHRDFLGGASAPGGRFPKLGDRDLYGLAQIAMGQGKVVTTPLHMAVLTAAIAAGGEAPAPRFSLDQAPDSLGSFMSPAVAAQVGAMMRKVVTEGTGRRLRHASISIAGKTGTADHGGEMPHAWFIAFAPYEAPRLAISVLVENGGFGSKVALPIAAALFEQAHDLGYVEIRP